MLFRTLPVSRCRLQCRYPHLLELHTLVCTICWHPTTVIYSFEPLDMQMRQLDHSTLLELLLYLVCIPIWTKEYLTAGSIVVAALRNCRDWFVFQPLTRTVACCFSCNLRLFLVSRIINWFGFICLCPFFFVVFFFLSFVMNLRRRN